MPHNIWLLTGITVDVGSTVMVKVVGVPVQLIPPLVITAVAVIVAVIADAVVLVAIKLAMLPVPVAAKPILVAVFVQLYTMVLPAFELPKLIAAVAALLHKV